jgi:hypothetical protein
MELETNIDQPETESEVKDNQPENKLYSVNGKEISGDDLLNNYNNLQKEFTKKSQKVSEYEKN